MGLVVAVGLWQYGHGWMQGTWPAAPRAFHEGLPVAKRGRGGGGLKTSTITAWVTMGRHSHVVRMRCDFLYCRTLLQASLCSV